jgi:hypothetical protein
MGLEIAGFGIFEPDQYVVVKDPEKAKKYLDTGYFDKIKEVKKEMKKVKKSKKKGVDN